MFLFDTVIMSDIFAVDYIELVISGIISFYTLCEAF